MNNNSKTLQELIDEFKDIKNHPELIEQYIKILSIKTCTMCGHKEYFKDNICPQCKRDTKLNKILK